MFVQSMTELFVVNKLPLGNRGMNINNIKINDIKFVELIFLFLILLKTK